MSQKVLVVDDEQSIVTLLKYNLETAGYIVEVAYDGEEALKKVEEEQPELIVLDVMLPKKDGIEVCKSIRSDKNLVPILMLTAKDDEFDRVLGLELGADDYLPKPFNDRELVARIKAILRRVGSSELDSQSDQISSKEDKTIEFDELILHPGIQQASYQGIDLSLTGSEFALLYKLALNPGQIISREELSVNVLGKNLSPFDRSIDMHMSNLRKKLPERKNGMPWLKTLRGRGYLLVCE